MYSLKPEYQALTARMLLTNPTDPVELFSNYDGLEFVLRRRLQNRWMFQGSYNLGHSYGNIGTLFFDAQGNPYSSPNNLINLDGDQKLDRRHLVKMTALYELPLGIQFSGQFQYLSGLPMLTTGSGGAGATGAYMVRFLQTEYPAIRTTAQIAVPGEPQGSRRHEGQVTLDLRAQRRTQLPRGASLDLMLDTFNLFNSNTVIRVETLNSWLTNFLRPAEILLPRAIRFGARVELLKTVRARKLNVRGGCGSDNHLPERQGRMTRQAPRCGRSDDASVDRGVRVRIVGRGAHRERGRATRSAVAAAATQRTDAAADGARRERRSRAARRSTRASARVVTALQGRGDGPSASALPSRPADQTNYRVMDAMNDLTLARRIQAGGLGMPSFPQLRGDDLVALVGYVRRLSRPDTYGVELHGLAQDEVRGFEPVSDAALAAPPPEDWLSFRGTPDAAAFSPLTEITHENVGRLQLAWSRAMEPGGQYSTPLVRGGHDVSRASRRRDPGARRHERRS